jgi:hypothetical protein
MDTMTIKRSQRRQRIVTLDSSDGRYRVSDIDTDRPRNTNRHATFYTHAQAIAQFNEWARS